MQTMPAAAKPEPPTNLVLSRRAGQTIHIGEDILMEVKHCRDGQVSLRFRAPRSVNIVRGELRKAA